MKRRQCFAALAVAAVFAMEGCATMAEPVIQPPGSVRSMEGHLISRGCPEAVHAPFATYDAGNLKDVRDGPPVATRRVAPVYPDEARAKHVYGVVAVAALVCEHGRVVKVHMVKSIPMLDEAALTAVGSWLFEPLVAGGVPVSTWVRVPVRFSLQ